MGQDLWRRGGAAAGSPVLAVQLPLHGAQVLPRAHVAVGAPAPVLHGGRPGERPCLVGLLATAEVAGGHPLQASATGWSVRAAREPGTTSDRRARLRSGSHLRGSERGRAVPAARRPRPCGSGAGRGTVGSPAAGDAPLPGARTFVRVPGLRSSMTSRYFRFGG